MAESSRTTVEQLAARVAELEAALAEDYWVMVKCADSMRRSTKILQGMQARTTQFMETLKARSVVILGILKAK